VRLDPRPETVFVVAGAVQAALEWAFWLLIIVWWVVELELSSLALVLTGTVFTATLLVAEVPTGVLADSVSRKWSVVLANVGMGVAMIMTVANPRLWAILAAQGLYALSWSFQSGADIAWVTAEVGEETDTERLLLRAHRAGLLAGCALLPLAALVGSWSLSGGVAALGACSVILGLVLARVMVDDASTPDPDERPAFGEILRLGVELVGTRPRLRVLLVVVLIAGLPSDALDRLGPRRFFEAGDWGDDTLWANLVVLLAMAAFGLLVNLVVSASAERGRTHPLLGGVLLLVAGLGAALVAGSGAAPVIAVGLMTQDAARESLDPVIENWVNAASTDRVRATVHSLVSQAFSVSEVVGGLVVSLVVAQLDASAALALACGVLVLAGVVSIVGGRECPNTPPQA